MDQWNAEIDKLEARARGVDAEARLQYQQRLQDLRAKQADLRDKVSQVQEAGEGAWDDLRAGLEHSQQALSGAIEAAISRFK